MAQTPVANESGKRRLPYTRSQVRVQGPDVAVGGTHGEMSIGQLARAAEVHVETIRYYQRLGLLPIPVRCHGGQRRYGGDELKRLCFIKRAQGLGFSLEEIRSLLGFAKQAHCLETKRIAVDKLAVVERMLADLTAMRATLVELIRACESGKRENACPIIECLSQSRAVDADGPELA